MFIPSKKLAPYPKLNDSYSNKATNFQFFVFFAFKQTDTQERSQNQLKPNFTLQWVQVDTSHSNEESDTLNLSDGKYLQITYLQFFLKHTPGP